MMNAPHNPNRSLIRIFCLSLSGLLLVYSLIAVHNLFELKDINATELASVCSASRLGWVR